MKNILIIKTNASGDVLRTTVLLNFLRGNIFWLTASYNIPLFPDQYPQLTLVSLETELEKLSSINFDLVINLEEDDRLASWVISLKAQRLIGVYHQHGQTLYTQDSASWFDMSLISRFSREQANDLKLKNTLSYQALLCDMIGEHFSGEPYVLNKMPGIERVKNRIGIEPRVGKRWPNKQWHGYQELTEILADRGNDMRVFKERENLRQYMADIQGCGLIITGDTLAMHIAIGYSIPCIAIFNCTSPHEIFDYGIVHKIVSPLLHEVFYQTAFIPAATRAVSISSVMEGLAFVEANFIR